MNRKLLMSCFWNCCILFRLRRQTKMLTRKRVHGLFANSRWSMGEMKIRYVTVIMHGHGCEALEEHSRKDSVSLMKFLFCLYLPQREGNNHYSHINITDLFCETWEEVPTRVSFVLRLPPSLSGHSGVGSHLWQSVQVGGQQHTWQTLFHPGVMEGKLFPTLFMLLMFNCGQVRSVCPSSEMEVRDTRPGSIVNPKGYYKEM